MKDYNVQNNKFIKNGLVIADGLLIEIERLRVDRISDNVLSKYLDYFKTEIEKLKITIAKNPKLDWINLEEEIARLYALDPTLTGLTVNYIWKEGNRLAYYNHFILLKS